MATRASRGRLRLVDDEGGARSTRRASDPGVAETERPPASQTQATVTPLPTGSHASHAHATGVALARAPLGSEPSLHVAYGAEAASPPTRAQLATLSDAQLVALGCTGEVGALEMLYRRYSSFAIHLAARIEGSSRDVEDIAHDAFVRAFERLPDLSDRAAFKSWLGAIVVHAVRSRMRRHRLMNLLGLGRSSEPVDLDALASPDASPHVRAQIAQIYALLRTLPTDDRIAWTLRSVEGHDLETVARMTRCSLATVKRRIARAQRFLDEHFIETEQEAAEQEATSVAADTSDEGLLSSALDLNKEDSP